MCRDYFVAVPPRNGPFHVLAADPIERRMAITTPPNRLTTQRRLLRRAGGDAHGCSNDALVRSASNSGPDWADYGRGASARRDYGSKSSLCPNPVRSARTRPAAKARWM